MLQLRILPSFLLFLSGGLLTACAGTSTQLDLAAANDLHCGPIPSVTVVDDILTIGVGEKPTPGYAVQLSDQSRKDDHVKISYQISSPREGAFMAQMMTSPCSRIVLPEGWQRLSVENQESGQQWVFENTND